MNRPNLTIRRAIRADAATAAQVVATAFCDLDVCRWLIPDAIDRPTVLAGYFRIVVDHAITHGTVETLTDKTAVAVWLPSSASDIPGHDATVAAVCGLWAPRFQALEAAMHQAHPTDRGPHEYLALLAVLPDHQNQGLGSALLDNRHAALDAAGRPAYLEASNSRSRGLYVRRGYVDCASPLNLPYDGEPVFPMWRAAQPTPREQGPHPMVLVDGAP
ncbi:MAG TPA: GNAT family N-acetyltransferase [Planosporangium sp.]|nr:GNAT family N-acetyltransferase [Planosporangium sp.]